MPRHLELRKTPEVTEVMATVIMAATEVEETLETFEAEIGSTDTLIYINKKRRQKQTLNKVVQLEIGSKTVYQLN